jgi:hypothetical protein
MLDQLLQMQFSINRRLEAVDSRLDSGLASVIEMIHHLPSTCLTSQTTEGDLSEVCKYYSGDVDGEFVRKCLITSAVTPWDGAAGLRSFAKLDRVMNAHIIPRSRPEVYNAINATPHKGHIDPSISRASIPMLKWLEVLFDAYFWCLLPVDPFLEHAPSEVRFYVHVLCTEANAVTAFRYVRGSFPAEADLTSKIGELVAMNGRIIVFARARCPSMRCLNQHALWSYTTAKTRAWITTEQLAEFRVFADLSVTMTDDDDDDDRES